MAVQDDNPRIKLWQTLSDQGKYTKPYEEFFQQFNTPEKVQKLYGALNGDGSYTKSYDEFTAQYFDGLGKPKGVSAQGSAATSTTSVEPSPSANVPTGSSTSPTETSTEQLPPLADPTNIAPQIQQANRIASEYDQEGESFLFEVPEGFEIVEGDVDENNRLLEPFMRNLTTGERFNIIRPTDPTTLEQAARLREQGAGAINPDKVTFTESIANSWKNMLDRFESIPMRQEIANGGMLQIRPEALANMTDQQRNAAFEQARQNYYNAYEALEQFQRENPGAPTREIVESWQNNDASGLVAGAFNALTGFATSLALGSLSGGVPLAVDIVGDFKADYNEEKAKSMGMTTRELAERGLAEDKAPVILAGISYAGEKLGLEGVGKLIPKSVIQSVARKITSSPYAKAMLKGVIDAGGEGLTEVLSTGLQETSTDLATKEDYTGGEVFERVIDNTFDEKNWENFWQGVIGKGLMSGSGAVTNTLLRRSASNPELKNKVEQLIEVAGTIGNNAENSPAMNMVFNNLVTEVSQGIADDALVRESLSEPQQDRISNLEGQVVMLEDSKQQAGDNEVLNGAIDSEIQRAQAEIENIKTDAVEQGDLDIAGSSVADALSPTNPIVVLRDGEQGVVRLDGQTVVFETADTIRELGNVDQISDSDLSVFGLEVEQPLNIDVSADNSITIDGTTFQNINEDPMSALNYNENGDVVSVTLQNENGRNRTIRGQRAQEIAYLYTLKEFEQNATEEQIQSVLQDTESAIQTTQENGSANVQAADGNTQQVQTTERTVDETEQPNLESAEILSESSQVAPVAEAPQQTEYELTIQDGNYVGDLVDGLEFVAEGSESTVYRDGDSVIKVSEPYNSDESYDARVRDINLISDLFGDGSTEVIGFYRSANGARNPITRQNFVEGDTLTEDEVVDYLRSRGVTESDGKFYVNSNGQTYQISDFSDNFIRKPDGQVVAIDLGISPANNVQVTPLTPVNDGVVDVTNTPVEAIPTTESDPVGEDSTSSEGNTITQEESVSAEPIRAPNERSNISDRTRKAAIKKVSDRLSKTGLVSQVDVVNSETLMDELSKARGGVKFQNSLFGFTLFNNSDFTKTLRGRITGLKPNVQQQIQKERSDIERVAKSNGTWLKAPNGRKSNLNADQWVTVRTKRFKDWFGDWQRNPRSASKVIDANGEPALYYSGSSIGFNEFSKDFFYSGEGAMYYGAGFYFTPRLETARSYSRQSRLGNERRSFANEFQDGLNRMAFLIGTELPTRLTLDNRAKSIQTVAQIEAVINDLRNKSRGQSATITRAVSNSLDSATRLLNDRKVLINSGSGIQLNMDVRAQIQNVMDTAFIAANQEIQRAETFGVGEGNVFSVFLNARNPLNWEAPANPGLVSRLNQELSKRKSPRLTGQYRTNGDIYRAVADSLKEPMAPSGDVRQYTETSSLFSSIGIDAVLHTTFADWRRAAYFNQAAGEEQLIVFEPSQIKSATANEGTFDTSTPDIRFQSLGSAINGFYDQNTGRVVINEDTAGIDTPIHEFAHAWEQLVEKENPELHARGIELIQSPEGQTYVDFVRQTQSSLEGRELYKEALVQAIGDRGARLIESQQNSLLKKWLRDAWKFIGNLVGISGMTADQIGNLTLNEYADAVATDLLSGQPYRRMPNGDIVAQTEATSESQIDEKEKFMNDFILRMKKRNGINFQGTVDGSLSPEDLTDLVTYFRFAAEKGQLDRIEDARATARIMGINNPSQVDMAYRLAKLQVKDSTGFKKAEVSLDTITKTDFTKLSDDQYRDLGKRLVDEGLVVPQTLVANIIEEPRALQPWEVTSLQYYRTQIESQIADASDLVESGNQSAIDTFVYTLGSENITGYKGIAAKMEVVNAALFDLEVAMLTTANQQSAAFRLRSLMSDKDFNVVQYLAEMKARGYVDPAIEQKLKDLSAELNTVRAKLKRKSEEAERLAERIAEGNINQEASQPVRQTRRVRVKQATVNAVNTVLDALDLESFGLPKMRFQANNTIRFQANSDNALSEAVGNAIAQMRNNITDGTLSVSDAIEQAISEVNGIVGEGNWDSVKFRSTIANQLVQQSVPVKVKKPYVNSEGVLIVPGEYIKQLVRDGSTTIDDMVVAVQGETGGAFDSYDIRNAISGYGRQTASKRTDLDRKVAKARRVARLLSQIEDLTTKGERLKTQRQVHDNDTEINNLKEQVRQLEYDLEMTPEERAQLSEIRYNEGRRKYLTNYIEQLQERIDNKDFAPVRHQNKFEEDAETRELRAQAERVKNEFKKEKYRHELENRTKWEKWRTLAYDVIFNITRGLSAGADASAIGVQGAIFSAARPRQAYKVLAGSLPGTFSEEQYEAYFSDLQADPLYDVARKAGLNMQLPNFYQSVQEEQYKGQLPELLFNHLILDPISYVGAKATGRDVATTREVVRDKANVFTLGDRNYSLVLSQIRMDLFREFITNQQNKLGLNLELDDAAVKRVASVVNDITMASKVPGLQGKTANDIISAIMFSARKFVATWKILGGWMPLLAGPNRNYQLFKDAYGSVIGRGLGTMFLTAAIPTAISGILKSNQDDDEEDPYFYNPYFFDPRHSDFLKLKAENTRISLFQGIDGNVVFATRFISGEYMTSSSQQVRPLNGEGFNKDRLELSWDYISNKFAPTASIAVSTLQGDRERQEAYGRFQESLAPMWATGIREQYENTGNTLETGTLATLGFFGLSYNNYGGAEFAKGRGTDNKKARDIFQKSGLSAYDPAEGQRTYWNGEEIVKVTDKVAGEKTYTDKYLPAYQQFMTEAVVSKENKLARDVNWEIKEGVIKELKREAYKYAEIKTSGIQAKGNFATFSDDGTKYHLLESQYNIKADYIKEYMDRQANRDRKEARQEVAQKLREDKIKPTDGYRQMLIELNLYNRANKYANERLIRDMKRRKIKLVKQAEYNSDIETQEEE